MLRGDHGPWEDIMSEISSRRRSPSIWLACLVLAIAVVPTAAVGAHAASRLTRHSVKRIADKEIVKKGAGLSVAHAATADSATSATAAATAASAQPAAFAHVMQNGTMDVANSKNVGSVSKLGTSNYCFSGIPFTPR